MENLVGDFGGAPEIPGNDGAVSRVPGGGIGAAQELGAFLEEEYVQGLLDGCLVASHHLQKETLVTRAPWEHRAGAHSGTQGVAGLLKRFWATSLWQSSPKCLCRRGTPASQQASACGSWSCSVMPPHDSLVP